MTLWNKLIIYNQLLVAPITLCFPAVNVCHAQEDVLWTKCTSPVTILGMLFVIVSADTCQHGVDMYNPKMQLLTFTIDHVNSNEGPDMHLIENAI